jgi:hypothetical protein
MKTRTSYVAQSAAEGEMRKHNCDGESVEKNMKAECNLFSASYTGNNAVE